jgi:hypothetical protein
MAQGTKHQLDVIVGDGAPVSVVSSGWGESRTASKGAALLIDLKTTLRFRNNSRLRLRGISLEVRTADMAAGSKASVSVPSLNVNPGEDFPVKVDLRLLQPSAQAAVTVQLDGVLFEDLSFFGPNTRQSRRTLTAWEMEARRDRQQLRQVLAKRGEDGLRQEILEILARDAQQPHLDVKVARGPAALPQGENIALAFRRQADWPVEGLDAKAIKSNGEIRIPEITVASKTDRDVRFVEYMLLARDAKGRLLPAGNLPSTMNLRGREKAAMRSNVSLQISRLRGEAVDVQELMGVLSRVEFSNGDVWIPSRRGLDQLGLTKDLPASMELQRLGDIYRKKDLPGLLEELARFD